MRWFCSAPEQRRNWWKLQEKDICASSDIRCDFDNWKVSAWRGEWREGEAEKDLEWSLATVWQRLSEERCHQRSCCRWHLRERADASWWPTSLRIQHCGKKVREYANEFRLHEACVKLYNVATFKKKNKLRGQFIYKLVKNVLILKKMHYEGFSQLIFFYIFWLQTDRVVTSDGYMQKFMKINKIAILSWSFLEGQTVSVKFTFSSIIFQMLGYSERTLVSITLKYQFLML